MDKKTLSIIVIVVVALAAFIFTKNRQDGNVNPPPQPPPVVNEGGESTVKQVVFPEKPGPGLTRYSFEGDVKAVNATDAGKQIILENAGKLSLPDFTIKSDTRIWKKAGTQFEKAAASEIKVGSHVDLQLDKEDTQGFWIFRDIYILK